MYETETRRDRCVKCGQAGIQDTDLILVANAGLGPGWFGMCEGCTRDDGVDPDQGYRLAELRAGTLFSWWRNHVRQMPMRPGEDF